MRNPFTLGLVVVSSLLVSGAGTEAQARYSRRTPITEAVRKTREGVLSVRASVQSSYGTKPNIGTAVIIDDRGYAITNAHVVKDCQFPTVVLFDGTKLRAETIIFASHQDLAILRLPKDRKYKELTLASGKDILVGEDVISVGNPFGYTNTVSTGIVSALGRTIEMPSGVELENLIQTNASINPGNSGGPLLNINGEVIGINVAVREDAQGIAFALNIDTVKSVLAKNLSAWRMSKVRHGILCKEQVRETENEYTQQLVVSKIDTASPASDHLQQNDIIVRVGKRTVSNRFDLERALWSYELGSTVEASILRDGKTRLVSLKFEAPEPVAKAEPKPQSVATANPQPKRVNDLQQLVEERAKPRQAIMVPRPVYTPNYNYGQTYPQVVYPYR